MEDYQSFPLTAVTLLDRSLTFLTNHRINLVSIFKFSSSIDRSFARDEIYIYFYRAFVFRGSDACAAVLLSRIYSLLQRGGGEGSNFGTK